MLHTQGLDLDCCWLGCSLLDRRVISAFVLVSGAFCTILILQVGLISLLAAEIDERLTMTVIESITVLLHEHGDTVQGNENRMCPGPISISGKRKVRNQKKHLPGLGRE